MMSRAGCVGVWAARMEVSSMVSKIARFFMEGDGVAFFGDPPGLADSRSIGGPDGFAREHLSYC